ncbi:hypothetical protein DM02DRAFT_620099 [Periconia macrospinosa]|uniref:Uncharacterized protein n=1 Tax=Periconia macrospinosa TaxID=97972 RepID=A0A2V1D3I1_9PLEO|nr:hypothetical protein DM02DRAFT_620099 [Periconia macrospinosa]
MANQASVIPAASAQVELQDVEKYTPGPNEVLVKVRCIGFSPIEAKIQKYITRHRPNSSKASTNTQPDSQPTRSLTPISWDHPSQASSKP